ncbi:aminoacyl-histidine dipeptidase [Christiangramia forsetii]|uniref:Cytosol non-specific dipeptidase n=2 Tax=Christiangramia forsetii TaxID=411153 RepID=A0LZG6_CHRFK|nr:aminoacyl-histidine dipeptidase [Christiangramia forsetii]GGG38255.1 aminoacyl-histidine dipeptidase [Christiangramia forsetii]CAL65761.1 aminoacyl-histidine dipeptidase [Christiangramia forsetii KT0803]
MNEEIRALEPKVLWNKFADLNAVPRPSKKEERVIEFIKNFGNNLDLKTEVDSVGNVVIYKAATKGMESRKKIVLQAHLDMVHQKNNDTDFNFDTQGIEMYVDGDWVRARGTTLGADNGLGVATMMAILESDSIEHPAIEALFTIDEETGMTGAKGLSPDLLEGDILLNLDTEEDDEIGIGCAGGVDITAIKKYEEEKMPETYRSYSVKVKGLSGGHSGMDIIKGLGNANKLMNRLLLNTSEDLKMRVSEINGGGLRNAIPRESEAIIALPDTEEESFKKEFESRAKAIKSEYASLEPNLSIELQRTTSQNSVMDLKSQKDILLALAAAHNGVYRMSPEIEGLVEASNNVAKVALKDGEVHIKCLTRSSVESSKDDLADSLKAVFELAGFEVKLSGEYPGWAPNSDSAILKTLDEIYQNVNGSKADIAACHAGLECGIIGSHYPNMDMISFGPTIRGAHSPDERASVKSAQKYWKFLLEVLKNIPEN